MVDLHRGGEEVDVVDKAVPHLLEQSPLLDDVRNSLLFEALLLVHVLERVQPLALFMLDDSNLNTGE